MWGKGVRKDSEPIKNGAHWDVDRFIREDVTPCYAREPVSLTVGDPSWNHGIRSQIGRYEIMNVSRRLC